MLLPVRYMWEQLNGPQVSALSDAVFQYWKQVFDKDLDYFNNISIETASDIHLTLLGLLSGLIRPSITEADAEFFYFTENSEHPMEHGFGDTQNPQLGGRFSKSTIPTVHNTSLDMEYYRALLRAWVSGDGEIGSLQLLDDICYEITKLDVGTTDPFYSFSIMQGSDIPADRAPGDVFIDMKGKDNWHNPLHVYAVLNGIASTAYAPQPRLFVSIGVSGQVTTPAISPAPGEHQGSITVTMTVTNPDDAKIYYTTDGSTPTEDSIEYTGPFVVSESCIITAIGKEPYYGDSDLVKAVYNII